MEEQLPGFRFYPTEEELISFYLHSKLLQTRDEINRVIPLVEIYSLEPWHLPKVSGELCYGETEQWFFFTSRQEREARGGKPNRTTASGYWKATGSPCYVYSSDNRVIGVKKTLVFYKGRAPSGRKTKWKMNEYTAIIIEEDIPSRKLIPKLRRELSLCRVYVTSGRFGAYNRRPLGPGAPQAHDHKAESDPTVELAGSPESSSHWGEEHIVELSQAGEMVNGLEPLWEWESWL